MFGIGKLANLKYLKVVAAVLISSFAIALPFFFVVNVLNGDYSGIYAFYFLPIAVLVGYLMKKRIDKKETELL